MKIIRESARVILGAVFVFSGFVKGIDPLGSAYKFSDYFNAFGAEWASGIALALSFLLSAIEFGIGTALLVNYQSRIFSWLAVLFMAFFIPLTLWIAIKNPVTDCGCFGDALVISNWETFYKNIVLGILAAIILRHRNRFKNRLKPLAQNTVFVFFMLFFFTAQLYSYRHLPLLDFRPYKVGVNIPEGMQIPDNAPADEYKTIFEYKNKNTGDIKEFDETNYPWQDTINWEYHDSESILIKEGYHPPIYNFTMVNEYGEDVYDYYLYDPSYTFILVAYDLKKTNTKRIEDINNLAVEAMQNGANFICLTAAVREEIDAFRQENNTPFEFFFCDEITLKTMIRSNPGLLLTHEGTIFEKWSWRDIPTYEEINFDQYPTTPKSAPLKY